MRNVLHNYTGRGAPVIAVAAAAVALAAPRASAVLIYGVTADDTLFSFDSATPDTITSALPLTGFDTARETIRAMDFRPSNSTLYAIGSFGQLYTVNTTTATLTPVGAPHPINGTSFGFDFDPKSDTARLISDTDRYYIINPDTGAQTAGPMITFGPGLNGNPTIVGLAFSNGALGGGVPDVSTFYGLDTGLGLMTIDRATGVATRSDNPFIFASGVMIGFDIYSEGPGINTAFVTNVSQGDTQFQIRSLSGGVSSFYTLGGGAMLVTDIAATPEPAGAALFLAAAGAGIARRGRRGRTG